MNPKIDAYIDKSVKWQEELHQLREIILDCNLTEELKWGVPCYTFRGANVVLIHSFKEYCALLFFKGALLSDSEGVLFQQTSNVQAARQVRFTTIHQILGMKNVLKAYVFEAIEIENAGLKVELKKTEEYLVAEEFQRKLEQIPELKIAFELLTPGRQRAYLLYFSQPKQSTTREARIEKYIQKILSGKGMTD